MRFPKVERAALFCALVAAVSSCGSRVETQVATPPADDLKVELEPPYPVEALEECPTDRRTDPCPAQEAEDLWWSEVLAWARTGWGNTARTCIWARDLGKPIPEEWCKPEGEE